MIIYHQTNAAALVQGHVYYWPTQPLLGWIVSQPGGAAAATLFIKLIGQGGGLIAHGGLAGRKGLIG